MSSIYEKTDWVVGTAVVPSTVAGTPYSQTNLTQAVMPCNGTVVGVTYVPSAGITANGTNFQTLNIRNGGPGASGSTVIATRAWSAGNSTANTAEAVPLSGTAANLEVKAGDILHYISAVSGAGVALPAGTLIVSIRPHR